LIAARPSDLLPAMRIDQTPWKFWFNLLPRFVRRGRSPHECDTGFYRFLHDDLASFSSREAREHFRAHGTREGRIGSPAAHRSGFMEIIPRGRALEIGPFTRAALRGRRVRYLDVMDKAGLMRRAAEHNLPTEHPVDIDFVSPDGSLDAVPDRSFDIVFSSHCIEHQADLIRHLREVARVLVAGGAYYLIIPDKRYCFDHYIDCSGIEDVRLAHAERRKVHVEKSVIEHLAFTTHNDSIRHWSGDHGEEGGQPDRVENAKRVFADANGAYIDVHAWQFVPDTFREITGTLYDEGATGLKPERVYQTVWGLNEFTAILRKPSVLARAREAVTRPFMG
jgi:SAM-dependent methyltransferase